jgi:hypothetical protein
MPYYFTSNTEKRPPFEFGDDFSEEFGDDFSEEFGDAKSDAARKRAAAARKLAAQRAAAKRAAAQRVAAQRAAAKKPKSRFKATKTKNPSSIKPDDLALSRSIFRDNGRGNVWSDEGVLMPESRSTNNPLAPPRITVVSSTAKTSKLDSIFGITSQIISGWSKNKTVQTADGQTPIYNLPEQGQPNYQPNYQPNENYPTGGNNGGGAGANVGESLGGGFDGIINWASQNPLIVLGIAGGAYLLFKQPPKYGNR